MAFTDITARSHATKTASRVGVSLHTLVDLWKSRRALARLDQSALNDIGIDAAHALKESAKPVWDVPATWRR